MLKRCSQNTKFWNPWKESDSEKNENMAKVIKREFLDPSMNL